VTLTVTDAGGLSHAVTKSVTVTAANLAPTAVIGTPTCLNLVCDFSGSGSTDPEGQPLSYSWNFGDGSSGANNTATGATASHTFTGTGTYTVTLTVSDGSLTGTTTRSVTVTALATTMSIETVSTATSTSGNDWRTTITFTVQNNNFAAVSGVTVAGSFNNGGGTFSCNTNASGQCSVTSNYVRRTGGSAIDSLTYTITGLTGGTLTYTVGNNSDTVDGTNNFATTTTITVNKP